MNPTSAAPDVGGETIEELRAQLAESRDTLRAIRAGEVDALVVKTSEGDRVFTLRGVDEPYRVMLEQMSEGAASLSPDGIVLYANRRLAEITGTALSALVGSPVERLVSDEQRPAFTELFAGPGEGRRSGVFTLAAEDDRRIEAQFSITPLPAETGSVWCMVATGVTGRVRVEQELERLVLERTLARDHALEASRLKSDFVANVSHEIRTPLNGVVALSELLRGTTLDERQQEFVDGICTSADALMGVISDILDFSKIEAGKVERNPENFSPRELVADVCAIVAGSAEEKGLELSAQVDPGVPEQVHADRAPIRQVLSNLLNNAVKFTRSGRVELRLTTEAPAGHIQLTFEVADTGIGIPEAAQQQLFESFVQADTSLTREFGGTGLGLAISKRLVELMGGEIGMRSDEGHGATFRFTVPCVLGDDLAGEVDIEPRAQPSPAAADRQLLHVLVAEDNEVNQLVALRLLEKCGCEAELARDGREAVEMSALHRYDVIFMDCQMPRLDGYAATAEIRAAENGTGHTPIVAMTANTLKDDRDRCLSAGMDDYIGKPLRGATLAAVIARVAGPGTTEQPPAGRSNRTIDPAALTEIGDPDTERRLAEMFIAQATDRLPQIQAAITASDTPRLRALAHGLKGSAASVGAVRLSELCALLCQTADGNATSDPAAVHRQLVHALADTELALTAYLAGSAR
ncbi:MAG: ATP-binding protein [Solirubrobacteraceae bacterium]